MKTIYNRRQEPDITRTLRREDTSYFSLYIKMAQPSIAMGEDLLCDPDPCLTDTFFQVPTLDWVQGRDLAIAGTKVDTCHRVLACTPFLVSSGQPTALWTKVDTCHRVLACTPFLVSSGQPTALYSLQSSCFKMASDRAKWSDYVPRGGTRDFKRRGWSNRAKSQDPRKSLGFPAKPKKTLDQKLTPQKSHT